MQVTAQNIPEKTEATTGGVPEEGKDSASKHPLSKFDYDLYKEEDDIALPVIRVKRTSLPNKGERWKIFSDGKQMLVIEGSKLNNKEKDFLRTIDGVNFLIARYKAGVKSFNALKKSIKKRLK